MEYPLAERELVRHAKRPLTFILRAALGLAVCPILSMFLLGEIGGGTAPADEIAAVLTGLGTFYLFFVAVLLPPFLTTGLIAIEKHQRTLGTLLLADLRATDVVISKWLPALLQVELLIVGSLPVLAFATVLGGITPESLLLQVLLFGLSALMFSAIGVFMSTVARQPGGAMMMSIIVLAPMLLFDGFGRDQIATRGGPEIPVLLPAIAALQSDLTMADYFWVPSALSAVGISVVCLGASILLLPRQVYEKAGKKPGGLARTLRRRRNPLLRERGTSLIFSRAAGGLSSSVNSSVMKIFFAVALAVIGLIPCVGAIFVAAIVMYDVVATMDNAKRSGVFDDIRLSAPPPKQFLWDIFYALCVRGWFYVPGIICTGTFGMGYLVQLGMILEPMRGAAGTEAIVIGVAVVACSLALGVAQLSLMTAIGCYQSGFGRNIRSQTITSVALYIVVNLVCGFLLMFAAILMQFLYEVVGQLAGSGIIDSLAVMLSLTTLLCAVYAAWTLGFYASYRTRHMKYV